MKFRREAASLIGCWMFLVGYWMFIFSALCLSVRYWMFIFPTKANTRLIHKPAQPEAKNCAGRQLYAFCAKFYC
jgi:hypothetical protein